MIINELGHTKTNNNGGINGGITNGNDLVFRVLVNQSLICICATRNVSFRRKKIKTQLIEGRHDAFIARRAVVVVENACAIALADLFLLSKNKGLSIPFLI